MGRKKEKIQPSVVIRRPAKPKKEVLAEKEEVGSEEGKSEGAKKGGGKKNRVEEKERAKGKALKEKKRRERAKKQTALLERWLYLERDGFFPLMSEEKALKSGERVIQLKGINRAAGTLKGKLVSLEEGGKKGQLQVGEELIGVDDIRYPHLRRRSPLSDWIGEERSWVYWPTSFRIREPKKQPRLKVLRLSACYNVEERPDNLAEVVGRLERVWDDFFEVKLWSPHRKGFFFIYVKGAYPYPDEVGEWVWVKGHLNAKEMMVELVEAETLAFVSKEELEGLLSG